MLVTFISQCEKKAINRTRRILDAFANRIGDNVWQTAITEDGLTTVKKLLRQSATKSTAVSCHRVRTRQRTELVWIVGNRNKFNEVGIVPVNWTEKEVFMDIQRDKPIAGVCYANTHLQRLDEHLFAVGYLARALFEQITKNSEYLSSSFAHTPFIIGVLHDLGKLDPHFQDWIFNYKTPKDLTQQSSAEDGVHIDKKFSFDTHPRHNELSLMQFCFFDDVANKSFNLAMKEMFKHGIYWHHAKPIRKESNFDGVSSIYHIFKKNLADSAKFQQFFDDTSKMIRRVAHLEQEYQGFDSLEQTTLNRLGWQNCTPEQHEQFLYQFKSSDTPVFKSYDINQSGFDEVQSAIKTSAFNNIFRACVVSADRLISSLSAQELHSAIMDKTLSELVSQTTIDNSTLVSEIQEGLSRFPNNERSQLQRQTAKQLEDSHHIAVLAGPAGSGKTKVALEWAKNKHAQKIFWVCPRVQVCQGIFDELTRDYLSNSRVEIFTGEFKFTNDWQTPTAEQDYFKGDVIVTTIDQLLSAIVTHTKVNSLIDFMNAHVIFDEYHEYSNMDGFNLLFAELVMGKKLLQAEQANTLLVSATPPYLYLEKLLGIESNDIIKMPSFNNTDYQINFVSYEEIHRDERNPLYQPQPSNSFVISNTAKTAQLSFIKNQQAENSILLHAKFKRSDKRKWFEKVYASFGKEPTAEYDILRSGPIVQASLNISCDNMVSEMTTAMNMLQRLGRLDRFGRNTDSVNTLTIAITDPVQRGKQLGASAKFLAKMYELQSAKAWYNFLQSNLGERTFKLTELYRLYEEFHQSPNAITLLESDLQTAIKNSVAFLNQKVSEPWVVVNKKAKDSKDSKQTRISKNSLRGDNRFVQMAVLDVNDYSHPKFINEYVYQPPLSDDEEFDNLTESLQLAKNYDLVDNMAKKQGIIDKTHPISGIKATQMPLRHKVIENYARDPNFPLYLSYTQDHLDALGGEIARHSNAIYYAVCEKQPIGAIALKEVNLLTNLTQEEDDND